MSNMAVNGDIHFTCSTPFWDSNLTWKAETPDFTLCFHRTALVWLPCSFLWLMSPLEIYYLRTSNARLLPWSTPNYMKLISAVLLVILTFIDLVYYTIFSQAIISNIEKYSCVFKWLSMILALALTVAERENGMNTTGVIYIFWILQFVCNLITYRSLLLSRIVMPVMSYIIFLLCFGLVMIQLVYSSISDKIPPDENKPKQGVPCPEGQASFFSRMVFSWVNGLIIKGYKKPLTIKDLWELDKENTASEISSRFDRQWNKERDNNGNNASMARSIFRAFGVEFVIAALLKLLSDLLVFTNPIVLKLMINFVTSDEPTWHGYYYAGIMFAASMVQSLLLNQHNHRSQYFCTRVRTAIMLIIYKKALRISIAVKKKMPLGEIVNLMAVDSQSIVDMLAEYAFYWSAPIQLFGAIYMLWRMLGVATMAGVVIMLIVIPLNTTVASIIKKLQQEMMIIRDRRLKIMTEMLTGIKVLKLYAWELSFYNLVQEIRNEEVKLIIKISLVKAAVLFLFQVTPILVTIATLGCYVVLTPTHTLDPAKVFVSLSLLNLLRAPLNSLPSLITMLAQAMVSFRRIQEFMNVDEIDPATIEHQDLGDVVISIQDSTFSWGSEQPPAISDVNLYVRNGELVVLVGPVGSGKSSLLISILGETKKLNGIVNTTGTLSYVSQQAWIKNSTLRKNILFGKKFNPAFYDEVINACALAQDLELLPGRDYTEIGEKGVNLSGGQKQRVSLARAVYSDSDIFLLDDPLSAVDSHVGKHLIDKVIGPDGMLRKKTRVLATHNLACLPYANQIMVLSHGRITETGTFTELLKNKGSFSNYLKMYLKTKTILDEVESQNFQENNSLIEEIRDAELKTELLKKLSYTYDSLERIRNRTSSTFFTPICNSSWRSQGGASSSPKLHPHMPTGADIVNTEHILRFPPTEMATEAGDLSTSNRSLLAMQPDVNEIFMDTPSVTDCSIIHRFRAGVDGDVTKHKSLGSAADLRVSPLTESKCSPMPSSSSPTFHQYYSPYSNKLLSAAELESRSKLITSEAVETGVVSWEVYNYYLRSMGYTVTAMVIFFCLVSEICNVMGNVWLSKWSSDTPLEDGTQNIPLRNYRLKVYSLLGLGQTGFMFCGAMLITYGTTNASRILHNDMLHSILRSPMDFFDQTPIGRLMNRFAKDMETVDETVPRPIRPLITHILHVVATIYIITRNTTAFFVLVPPLSALYYIIQKVYISTSRQLKRLEAISRSPIFAQFSETVTGLPTIRAYKKEQEFIKETEEAIDVNQILTYPRIAVKRWLALRLDFIGQIVVFATGAFAAYNRYNMPPGIVGLSISYAVQVTHLLSVLVRMAGDLENSIVSVERIKEYTHTPKEVDWEIEETKPPPDWPQTGAVQFVNFTMRYRENLDPALLNINIKIYGGEKIGLVGRTGSGKSSLTLALFRVIEASEGAILIDGIDISTLGLHHLRSSLTIIPQEPILFSGTLRLNLDPLNNHSDEELMVVLRQANLAEFVSMWNMGLDFPISEGGDNLSIGQRQLVCLARALLRKSKILILDEATAAVDLATDAHIQTTIRKEFADCTVITIAHRLNTIMDCNKVVVLVAGEVAEFDTPANLLARESIFKDMVKDAGMVDVFP